MPKSRRTVTVNIYKYKLNFIVLLKTSGKFQGIKISYVDNVKESEKLGKIIQKRKI